MATRLEKFEEQARQLTLQERSVLIEHLIKSLDDLDEQECERLWLQEAQRRFQAYKEGKISSRSAGELIREVRDKFGFSG